VRQAGAVDLGPEPRARRWGTLTTWLPAARRQALGRRTL